MAARVCSRSFSGAVTALAVSSWLIGSSLLAAGFDVVVMVSFFFPVVEFFRVVLRGECWLKAGSSPSLRS